MIPLCRAAHLGHVMSVHESEVWNPDEPHCHGEAASVLVDVPVYPQELSSSSHPKDHPPR